MIVKKFTPLNYFEIWSPRYKDNRVLLAAHKVGENNKIVFTKAQHMGTEPYYLSGKTIRKYPKESNGKVMCYAVPLDELEPLEIDEKDIRGVI